MYPHRRSLRTAAVALSLLAAIPAAAAAQGIEEPRIPLRTALAEINTLRNTYVEAFNRKDAETVASLYASDAHLIGDDGTLLAGAGLKARMKEEAPQWPHAVISSDTVRVYGNTAIDVGSWVQHPEGGGEQAARYMSVLRRDMQGWKLVSVAVVPVRE